MNRDAMNRDAMNRVSTRPVFKSKSEELRLFSQIHPQRTRHPGNARAETNSPPKPGRRYPGSSSFGLRPCRIWAPQRCTGLCITGVPTGNNIAADPAWQIPDNAAERFVRVKQRRGAAFPG